MSTQTFSKVFLFPNNKRKTENNFPITTGPAHGNDWPTATFGLRNRAKGKGDGLAWCFGPRLTWPSSAEVRRHATPAFQTPRRCGRCQRAACRYRPGLGKRACVLGPQEGGEPEQVTQWDGEGTEEALPRRGQARRRHDRRLRKRARPLYLAQMVSLQRAPGAGERGGATCARLRAMVDHRRPISPVGLRWRWRRE